MNKFSVLLAGAALAASPLVSMSAAHAGGGGTVPQCRNADLHVSVRGSDGAAGTIYHKIVIKNVSGHRCVTGGFGGVSFVGHGDGTQIGAPADRDGTAHTRVLRPGRRLVSDLGVVEWGNYSRHTCRPTHADGYRIYVPNSTRSQYVAAPQTVCANRAVHLMHHDAYHRP